MRNLFQLIPISRKYLGLGNKSDISSVMVDHRQIPRLSLLELVHDAVHLLVNIDIRRSRHHEIIHMHLVIQFRAEHILADVFKRHIAVEMVSVIDHWENIPLGGSHYFHKISQRCIDLHRNEIRFNKIAGLQKGQHSLVAVVGQELSPLRYSLGID